MDCPGCGFQVESDFAFCPRCGSRQPVFCASCGYPCAPDFEFCPKCGAGVGAAVKAIERPAPALSRTVVPHSRTPPPLPDIESEDGLPHPSDADRRTVTVLFADLCGFTTLSEQLDPEVIQVLQNELFKELTAAVRTFGGFVDKFIGDAMLALFGAPVAHEDDPERALRAARDMMARMARLGENAAHAGSPLLLHIGINTGPVVTGGLGVGTAKS